VWSINKHTELIDYANLETSKLSSSDISLIAKIATWCDTKWFIGVDKNNVPNRIHVILYMVLQIMYLPSNIYGILLKKSKQLLQVLR